MAAYKPTCRPMSALKLPPRGAIKMFIIIISIIIIIIINVSKRFTSILYAQLYTGRHRSRHCSEQVSSSRLSVSLFLCSSFNPR